MSEGWNIAVLGATGAVGEALFETLADRQFSVGDIYATARSDSAGEHLRFSGKSVVVQDATEFDWTRSSWPLPPASKRPRRISTTPQTRAAW